MNAKRRNAGRAAIRLAPALAPGCAAASRARRGFRPASALLGGLILPLLWVSLALAAGNIDSTYKWAWGTNVGWVNFNPANGGATVYSDHLEGYAWSENIGWIRLGTCTSGSPCTYANTSRANYGINNDGAGNLSGYAWSATSGWINFDPTGSQRVRIDPLTGDFEGYAWGENVGWIRFQNSMLNYRVRTSWSPAAPVANAGQDQSVNSGAVVTLNAGGSSSPGGHLPLTYAWTQTGGPAVVLSSLIIPNPTFTTPPGPAVLTFSLLVTDALGQPSAPDTVVITVRAPATYWTHLPITTRNHFTRICTEAIVNGSFENGTAWLVGPTARPARYGTDNKHSGNRSILLGLRPGEADLYSYSSVRQTIVVPASPDTTVLSFWVYPISGLDSGDRQECLLLNTDDEAIQVLWRANANSATWTRMAFDVTGYAGRTVKLYCNALNDGDGAGVTGFYLDDVSVTNCPASPAPLPPETPPGCHPATLTSVGVGRGPHGVALNAAANRLYVANHEDDTLSIINSQTNAVVATRAVGDGPNGVAYNAANGKIYVANRNSNSVSVLRASDNALVGSINVGSMPDGVAANANSNRIYVANFDSGTVSIISGANDALVQTIRLGADSQPSMVAVNPVTNKAYVSLHGTGRVAVIDSAGNWKTVDIRSTGPYGIAVDSVRNLVYVATITSFRIAVIDGATDTLLGWADVWREGSSPKQVPLRMIAVNPLIGTSGHVYVTTAGVDGGTDKLLLLPQGWPEQFGRARALTVDEPREGIAFDPVSLRLFVSSRADNLLAVYRDGEPLCADDPSAGGYRLGVCVLDASGSCRTVAESAGD